MESTVTMRGGCWLSEFFITNMTTAREDEASIPIGRGSTGLQRQRDYTTTPMRLSRLSGTGRGERQPQVSMINPISSKTKRLSVFVMACIMAAVGSDICLCDTQKTLQTTLQRVQPDSTRASHKNSKEQLLLSLGNLIEEQHLKLKPVRAFRYHQRPSKFDSGDDFPEEIAQAASLVDKRLKLTGGGQPVEDGMRQIMRMHDQAFNQNLAPPASKSSATVVREASAWRLPTASTLLSPNKMVSQLISYLSPLVGSKPIDQAESDQSTSQGANNSRIKLYSFVGRSYNQAANSSIGIKQMIKSHQSFVTRSPLKLVPVRAKKVDSQHPVEPAASLDVRPHSSQPSHTKSNFGQKVTELPVLAKIPSPRLIGQFGVKHPEPGQTETTKPPGVSSRLKLHANQAAQNYLQESLRDLLTLSQLPILSASHVSTAPSILEKGSRYQANRGDNSSSAFQSQRNRAIGELYRYAYILGTGVRRKRDPLLALESSSKPVSIPTNVFRQRSVNQLLASNYNQLLNSIRILKSVLSVGPLKKARPRGVIWDMATDPSLAVTVFHLLERASVALPLGFLLMPIVQMIRNPLNGINLGRILPARASHRSVDYEELAKRLDVVDKMLSRALRSTHRESSLGK